jgi:hypothetical protein
MPLQGLSVTKSNEVFPESHEPGYPGGTSGIRERVQARNVVTNGRVWQVLRNLPGWQITQIPRRPHVGTSSAAGQDQADLGVAQRLQALVSAFHYGASVAFG